MVTVLNSSRGKKMSGQYMSTEQITAEKPCMCLTCGWVGTPDEFAYLGQCVACDEVEMLEIECEFANME